MPETWNYMPESGLLCPKWGRNARANCFMHEINGLMHEILLSMHEIRETMHEKNAQCTK